MRVYITEPNYPRGTTPLISRLRKAWVDLGPAQFFTPGPFEVHGDLLFRVWAQIFRAERTRTPPNCPDEERTKEGKDLSEPDGIYLISESDFIIQPHFYETLKQWPWPDTDMICVPYTTRNEYYQVVRHTEDRSFTEHEAPNFDYAGSGMRLTGAWFLALNLKDRRGNTAWPPLIWLGPDGPRNDAANMAYFHAVKFGFMPPNRVKFLNFHYKDGPVPFMGVGYSIPGPAGPASNPEPVGLHTFFARNFIDLPGTCLLPHAKEVSPYTVFDHLKHIDKYLKEARGI